MVELTQELAESIAELPLNGICREFPNKLDHVINGPEDVRSPRQLHPAFYGCFDWHSAVHGHWTLVSLLKRFKLAQNKQVRDTLNENLTQENLRIEAAYLDQANRQSFERPYGWAWLLQLAAELHGWDDPDGIRWAQHLGPLESKIVERFLSFLPNLSHPIRLGLHSNTAFALALALDYAAEVGNNQLRDRIFERAKCYYSGDAGNSCIGEPGGADFLSPVLVEADLMRRILTRGEFEEWLDRLLPDPSPILVPVEVPDRTDPQTVHLDGLNLSRAWCMRGIAGALSGGNQLRPTLLASAEEHGEAGLASVKSGDYAGEHWLGSFAVYLLTRG